MSREENPRQEELSELEAALAALLPRADRLNRDRLMFLAGQASVESKIRQPAVGQIANLPSLRQVSNLPHVAAWPAAFVAMTGIAALLLVALAIRPAPPVVERIVERIVTAPAVPQEPAVAIAESRVEAISMVDSSAMVSTLPDWLAWWPFPQPIVSAQQEPFYPELRNQVLLHGLGSWKPRAVDSAAAGRTQEEPISPREQLNRWLEQEGVESAFRRLSTPTLRNPSGARS